ncbi:MAG: hypothetical protein EBT97_13500, partial [Actinobacteria bacterium]|nr:hypothetical protein [Actinomycetota bacterium]
LADLRTGWSEFVSRRWMVITVVCLSLFFLSFEAFLAVIAPVQMKEALGGASDMAVMMAGWGTGGLLGMILAIRLRPSRPMLAAWAVMPAHAVWMLGVAVPLGVPLLFVLAVVSGACIDLTFTFWGTVLQTHVPGDVVSRVGSFDALGVALLGPVGLLVAGPLTDSFGASSTGVMAAALAGQSRARLAFSASFTRDIVSSDNVLVTPSRWFMRVSMSIVRICPHSTTESLPPGPSSLAGTSTCCEYPL